MSVAHDALGLPLDPALLDGALLDAAHLDGAHLDGALLHGASADPSCATGLTPVAADPVVAAAPEIAVARPPAAPAPTGTEMDAEIAANWGLWSREIGRALLPTLERLVDDLPGLTSVLVATADGFNLIALGLKADDVPRVSAITSSLLSLGDAVTEVVDSDLGSGHGVAPALDLLTLRHGTRITVVRTIPGLIVGQLLLWLTGESASAPELEARSGDVAARIHELLRAD